MSVKHILPEKGPALSPEEKKRILRKRALLLAREPAAERAAGEVIDVIEFSLTGERYAVETSFVREVCPLREFTPLPGTPSFVFGLINVRGQIVSVVDIRKFFDLAGGGEGDMKRVIIVSGGGMEFGILADAIVGVLTIEVGEMQRSLPTLSGIREEFLRGITRDRLAVLDMERLLADGRIVVHDEAEA
jgi:purine-binding chemotaxis protein CheW